MTDRGFDIPRQAERGQIAATKVTDVAGGPARSAVDPTRRVAQQQRMAIAADHCRNALQMVLGLRQLADDLADLPPDSCPPGFSRDLGILADGIERRLSRAVEQVEDGWLKSRLSRRDAHPGTAPREDQGSPERGAKMAG